MRNIYNIPPTLPFLDILAASLIKKYSADPIFFSNITVFLPNRRSCISLREAFLRANDGKPMLMPQILPLGDNEDDSIIYNFHNGENVPENVISSVKERFILTELIEKWQEGMNSGEKITVPQAAHLAIELSSFLGEVTREQLSFDNIEDIVPSDLANHWQVTLKFLSILIEKWPEILAENNAISIHGHRNIILQQQAEFWQSSPPKYPVIAAGSTGSVPATANLLSVISKLENGSVILPGLDNFMDDEAWDAVGQTHPQYALKQLLEHFEIDRTEVKNWSDSDYDSSKELLISQAMLPAESTLSWNKIDKKLADCLEGAELVTTENQREEAAVIALMMKEQLHKHGKTAALITHDRNLAAYVCAIFEKWNVTIDDTAGQELKNTPQAIFVRLVAELFSDKALSPISLLKLMKNPFCANGISRAKFRKFARALEVKTMRGIRGGQGIKSLYSDIAKDKELTSWLEEFEKTIEPLIKMAGSKEYSFGKILNKHIEIAEKLATTDTEEGANILWRGQSGEQLQSFFDEILQASKGFKKIDPTDYAGLLDAMLTGQTFRPKYGTHPRLFILSPIEARMMNFDMVILGGLNEGDWPGATKADPWMSRPMRNNFGLPLPEKKIGQSAHDFTQLLCNERVVITRSEKSGGQQNIPSRWLLRLDAILQLIGKADALKPKKPWLAWAKLLGESNGSLQISQPLPNPDIATRPSVLSVTWLERLMRDPYSLYASKILKLRALDPIDKEPGAAEFGNFIHDTLEKFVNDYNQIKSDERYNYLLSCGKSELAKLDYGTVVHSFWWPRFERIASWFVKNEAQRRKHIKEIICERKGQIELLINGKIIKLEARADRIEIHNDGNVSIVDYKTGTVPIKKDVAAGLSPQMTIEGLILQQNGFNIKGTVNNLEYWKLSGGQDVAKFQQTGKETCKLIEEAEEGVKNLLEQYITKQTPFAACPDSEKAPRYNDYEHLERLKEWQNSN